MVLQNDFVSYLYLSSLILQHSILPLQLQDYLGSYSRPTNVMLGHHK